jgi:hypothetical protein
MKMDKKLTERFLVEMIKKKLEPQFDKIWTHKKISASPRFKNYIKNQLGYIPILQPEIDLVLKTNHGNLNAIEVKFLNRTTNGYNLPYYWGIGQALALQRFGFDHVGLWLFVGQNITEKDLHKYGAEAWTFIRQELELKIEYSYFRIIIEKNNVRFLVMKYSGKQDGYELLDIDDPRFLITWKHLNPLKKDPIAIALRAGIELYLYNKLKL